MAQPIMLKDLITACLRNDIDSDFKLINALHADVLEVHRRCRARGEQIKQLQTVTGSSLATRFLALLNNIQDDELEKNRALMRHVSETQIKALEKMSFLARMRKTY